MSVLLRWAGLKVQYVQQSRKFCVRADTQSWLNKSHKVDARTLVCVRPPAQYPLQNKLNSESLNYAALKVLGGFFLPFQRQGSVITVVQASAESQEG